MKDLRGSFFNMYTPFYDVIRERCLMLKEIFYIPYTVWPRRHITCSKKKVHKR